MFTNELKYLYDRLRVASGSERERLAKLIDIQSKEDQNERLLRLLQALVGSGLDRLMESKVATDDALQDSNPRARMAALILLSAFWPRTENLAEICERLLFNDPDDQVRGLAIIELGKHYYGTNDSRIGEMLATLVADAKLPNNVRRSAYASLYRIRGLNTLGIVKRDLAECCDWEFVNSFLTR